MEARMPVSGGWLTCRQVGQRAELTMDLPGDNRGLFRGEALGAGGAVPLGTLLPEGGRLRLCRSFAIEDLRRRGCWPVTGGRVRMTYAFSGGAAALPQGWKRTTAPEQYFLRDDLLARCARAAGPCLCCRREAGGHCLAWPWEPGRAFPLPPLFCLAWVRALGGRRYVLFCVAEDGTPVAPSGAEGEDGGKSCQGPQTAVE